MQLGKLRARSPHLDADPDMQTGGTQPQDPAFQPQTPQRGGKGPVAPGECSDRGAEPAGALPSGVSVLGGVTGGPWALTLPHSYGLPGDGLGGVRQESNLPDPLGRDTEKERQR